MKKLLILICIFYSFGKTNAQNIDLKKWYKMDSLICDINLDGEKDVFRIYNNSRLHSSTSYGFPVLLYVSKNSKLHFLSRFDKVVVMNYYKIDSCGKGKFAIVQDGEKLDRNKYFLYFKYNKGKVMLYESQVIEEVTRSKYDSILQKRVSLKPIIRTKNKKSYEKTILIEEVDFFKIFKNEFSNN